MKTRLVAILSAVLAFAVFSVLAVVILRGLAARSLLESQNDCERTINVLLSSLRDYEDFGAAIEGIPALSRKIVGISVFQDDGTLLHAWGDAPVAYPSMEFRVTEETNQMAEMYIERPENSSMIVLLRPLRPKGPPPEEALRADRGTDRPPRLPGESRFLFDTFRKADLIHLEIRQPEFWREKRLFAALLPVVEALLALLVAFVCFLVLKNAEYRADRERQKSLVLLGTAAGTLAHEIKNPLLAIRLQTGILSRTLADEGRRELAIIDDEVNRLSSLTHRMNDILRDPKGRPQRVDPLDIAAEVGERLCGRPVASCRNGTTAAARTISIDPERLRSVLENLIRNALESGGKGEEVAVEISAAGGQVCIDVLDRGAGIPAQRREQVFDPFFTTKSRGTGLGLAICRRFVLAARGTISLDDRPEGGSRVRVALPRSAA